MDKGWVAGEISVLGNAVFTSFELRGDG